MGSASLAAGAMVASRGVGLPDALAALLGPLVVLAGLLTQLGDLWFLATAIGLTYWLDRATPRLGAGLDRRRLLVVLALLGVAMVLVETLKAVFALPRPPDAGVAPARSVVPAVLRPLYAGLATAEGFGFPSGHATATTIVWGGLAWAARVGSRRRRIAVAGTVVAVVAFSRVALGVHFLADVLAGVALGLAVLAVVLGRAAQPGRALGLATGVALVALGAGLAGALRLAGGGTGVPPDLAAAAGVPVGATAVWLAAGEHVCEPPSSSRSAGLTAAAGLLVAGPLLALGALPVAPTPVRFLLGAAGAGAFVAAPLAGEALASAGREQSDDGA